MLKYGMGPMDNSEKAAICQWVARWRKAGPELARIRLQELRDTDTSAAIEQLEDSFQSALIHYPAGAFSGLLEQQRWFKRLKH